MKNKTQTQQAEHMDGALDDKIAGGGPPAVVAGIGAGAGALKSLKTILGGLPTGRGIAVVLIHHPELTKKNLFKLLKGQTALEMVEATDGMAILTDRVYVMPPEKFLSIARDRLTLTAPVHCDGLLMPIDHFFCSLASDRRNRCCGILLSGGGGDGTLGLSEIRANGGRTIVEDPKNAKFFDMPQHAIEAGVSDSVLTAEAIVGVVTELAGQVIAAARNNKAALPQADAGLRAILDILRARVGHDFRCYKPSTLVRRIHRRMTLGKIATMDDYARRLSDHPDEVGLLQKDLLIGVTDFFRQPPAWETLEKRVIASLMESVRGRAEIRIWVPGCASGKEVYSLAMLLTEQAERSGRKTDFQIFATDADLASLAMARLGIYPAEEIGENVSAERLKRFFARRDGHYQVIKSIREQVVFAAQNITADPPFSRLDLIICRNLLIYLDQQIQKRIIALFHFALRDGGFLFLGNAETVGDREDLFEPISKKWRIYRRIGVGHSVNVEIPACSAAQPALFKPPASAAAPRLSLTSMAQQALLTRFAPACVMIDRKLQVLYVHGLIEHYLTIPAGELTTRVVDMAREGLRVRLRGAIVKCIGTGRPVAFTARARRGEKSVPVKATVSPLRHLRETNGLLLITFEDQRIPDAVKSCRADGAEDDIRQLADELKITREELQSTIDQLEGSNDQLKASNEEVMAANEELQSANEEMETSKEELQSLNEELNTMNIRLQEKVDELESTNNDVVNLLASASIATLFLDKGFRIKRFTPAITGLMSLIPTDLGRPIRDILMRFTDEALLDDARRVLVDLAPLSREVQDDGGRWYIRRIMPYRTRDDRIEGVVLTFVDVMEIKQTEEALREAHKRAVWLARFPDENPVPVMRASAEGKILYCNPASMKSREWACSLGDPLPEPVRTLVAPAMASGEELHREVQLGPSFYAVTLVPFPEESYVNVYGREITKRKRAEEEIRRSEERLKRAQEIAHLGSWELDLIDNRLIWSDEVYRIFGLQPQEFAATYEAFLERVHPDDREAVDAAYSGSIRKNLDAYEIEHRVIRKHTGEIRFVRERCQHFRDVSGTILRSVGMVHDITERKRVEDKARRQSELLGGINRILTAALHSDTEEELGKTCLAVAEEITGSGIGFIGEIGQDGMLHVIAISNPGWEACRMADSAGQRRLPGSFKIHGIYGRVLRDGKALFTNDPVSHPDRLGTPPGHPPLASFLGAPFLSEGRVIGMIAVGNREAGYGPPQLEALEALAPVIREAFQRKRAEEALEASRAATEREKRLLETVMEALPVGVAVVDAKGGNIRANRAYEEVWGGPPPPTDSIDDYAAYRAWWPETGEPIRPEEWASARAVQKGESVRGQLLEIQRFDGSSAFVLNSASPVLDAEGKIVGSAVAIQNITALRRTEEALRESEERLKLFIEHAPAALAMFDREMHYLSVSRRWRSDYGLGERTLIGLSHYDVFPEIFGEWREAHRRGLAGEVLRAEADRFERADGSVQWVYWEIHPWHDAKGAVGGIVIFTEDITERKQAEDVLKERTEQLEAANRELESFSYSVSHDLRAPLRAIDGYSRMILRKHADRFDDDTLSKFNVIRDNTRMMGQLIDDLLAFSRLGRVPLSKVPLNTEGLISEIWEELKAINPDRRLTLKITETPPCRGDQGLIKQVLVNILSNAVKFTRGRGEALIEAGGYNKDGEIVYYIRDNGVGFDMQYHDKMFGVFQRLHSADEFEGTGVGLAIVQRIIHKHGGRTWAEGEIDRGACFYFSLPA